MERPHIKQKIVKVALTSKHDCRSHLVKLIFTKSLAFSEKTSGNEGIIPL